MLTLDSISFEFGGRFLFRDATLQIMPGDRIGLIGRNGTGKSTLLKVMVGEYAPTEGKVSMARNTKIGYLHQELLGYHSENSVFDVAMEAFGAELALREEINAILAEMEKGVSDSLLNRLHDRQAELEAKDGYNLENRTHAILAGLGFSDEVQAGPYKALSGGWRMRVMLAKILLQEPDVLLLDEPTNHLDLPSIQWLEEYLKSFRGAFVIVSHDRYFLDRLVTKTVEIFNQRFNIYSGNYSFYLKEREVRREIQARQYENQQKEIAQTEQFINRFRAKATKAKQVQSRIKSLERMDVVEQPETDAATVNFHFKPAVNPGKIILTLLIKDKSYPGKQIVHDSHAEILRGDKIALIGANGLGKSTMLRMVDGREPFEGERRPGHNVEEAFFAQHQSDALDGKNTILEEMKPFIAKKSETFVRSVLGGFLFSGDDVEKKIGVLSGGEKSRVALAKTLLLDANFLLLDEPTNHLDIQSIQILIQALKDYSGTFIVVSHDRWFLEEVANKIWYIEDRQLKEYPGTFTDFQYHQQKKAQGEAEGKKNEKKEEKKREKPAVKAEAPAEENKRPGGESREQQNRRRKMERELARTEEEIAGLEQKKEQLTREILDPSITSNYVKIGEIQSQITAVEKELEKKLGDWEKLGDELGRLGN